MGVSSPAAENDAFSALDFGAKSTLRMIGNLETATVSSANSATEFAFRQTPTSGPTHYSGPLRRRVSINSVPWGLFS